MRKITTGQIVIFLLLQSVIIGISIITALFLAGWVELGDFRGIVIVTAVIFFIYVYALLAHRILLKLIPFGVGEIQMDSQEEFNYHLYLLFYLMLFYPVIRSGIPPAPVIRHIYLLLGARMGPNSYTQGIIHDPAFVTIGENCLLGQGSLLIPHIIEGKRLAHYPISLGDNVTIGAYAVILAGVTIEDNAIVATGAVVKKGTLIRRNEVWGGIPAVFMKKVDTTDRSDAV